MPRPLRDALLVTSLSSVLVASALAGDLNPPPGPVAPTMNSLDAIEPRKCLNDLPQDEGAVVIVTEPGNYFMRDDIRGMPGRHGVRIVADGDVSIDLNGFSITGVDGSLDGINFQMPNDGARRSLSVRCADGSCRARISGWGGDGIRTENITVCRCTHLIISDNAGNGITHLRAQNIVHRDVAARACGGGGVFINDTSDGVAIGLVDVETSGCGTDGVFASINPTKGGGGGGGRIAFLRIASSGNGGNGVAIECPSDNFTLQLDDSATTSNASSGVTIGVQNSPPVRGGTRQGTICVKRWETARNDAQGFVVDLPESNQTAISADTLRCVSNGGDGFAIRGSNAGGRHRGHVTVLKRCEFMSNGGNGSSSDNPLHVENSTFGQNVLHGSTYNGPDPTELIGRCNDNVYYDNGLSGVNISRGRFASARGQFTGNGESGINCDDGCVVLVECDVSKSFLSGVNVSGTLNVTDSTFRRNGQNGVRVLNGSCIADGMVCELNGENQQGGTAGAQFFDCTTITLRNSVFNDHLDGPGVLVRSGVGPVRWMAPESIASNNASNGFDVDDILGGAFARCTANGNGGTGFLLGAAVRQCRVERCDASSNAGGGFSLLGQGNLIVGCRASTSAVGGYNIGAGNTRGPIITGPGVLANTNPDANIEY